jgi:hypothetical protein
LLYSVCVRFWISHLHGSVPVPAFLLHLLGDISRRRSGSRLPSHRATSNAAVLDLADRQQAVSTIEHRSAKSDDPKMFATGDIALMKRSGIFRRPRRAAILVVLALAAFAIVAIRSLREPVLRAAGWALVVNDPIAPADIIVLTLDSGGAGALEAADLVQSGISKRVAVFMDPPSGEDHEFIRRGLPYEDAGARQIRQLRSLGVTDVVQISRIDGTEGEGQVLPPWCDEHQLRSIVVVATKDHSRRLRRVLDRVMKAHPTRVTVQPARYSSFDPDRWWETRGDVRTEIIELQKLLLDVVLHPVST